MRSCEASSSSGAERRPRPFPPDLPARAGGFTLLELVAAITLFSFIVISVLADREKSLRMSGDARIVQVVQYLAAAKIDEIRHDPEEFGERESGDFEDYESDEQNYAAFSWEMEIEKVVAVGVSDEAEGDYLYPGDEDAPAPVGPDGQNLEARHVRKLTVTVNYEPDGELRPELSIRLVTYLPPEAEEDES